MKKILFILSLIVSVSIQAQNKIVSLGTSVGKINMLAHKPTWSTTKQPAIIFFHGIGERGGPDTSTIRSIEKLGVPKLTASGDLTEIYGSTAFNFHVFAPQLPLKYGDWDINIMHAVYDYVASDTSIDHTRIYVMGLSLGGGGVWIWLKDPYLASMTAAAVVACGVDKMNDAQYIKKYAVPVRIYHAADDIRVNISASEHAYSTIIGAGPTAACTYYRIKNGGHAAGWLVAFNRMHDAILLRDGKRTVIPNSFEWALKYKNDLTGY
jgi:predicted peptidase